MELNIDILMDGNQPLVNENYKFEHRDTSRSKETFRKYWILKILLDGTKSTNVHLNVHLTFLSEEIRPVVMRNMSLNCDLDQNIQHVLDFPDDQIFDRRTKINNF